MIVDDRIEPLVRRILGTVVKANEDEFDTALRALADDESRRKALELAVAVCGFVLIDAYGRRPSPAEVDLVAREVAEMERWSSLTKDEVAAFLAALLDHRPLDEVLDPQTAYFLTFVVAGCLLAASPKIGDDEWWFNYLDRVEAALEAMPSR